MLHIAILAALAATALARDIPPNVQDFYKLHLDEKCANAASSLFGDVVYCKDDASGAIYLKGLSGSYDNMDIDCDGANASEGLCNNDPTGQSMTAFMDQVQAFGIDDLDAHIHPYVVFGNDGDSPSFDPTSQGIEPLSVVAVVCNNQMFYGVWGDINGATSTGEASLAMGQLCFGDNAVSGDSGHDEADVLYISFPGKGAVPGASAAWGAKTKEEFEASLAGIGDSLVLGLSTQSKVNATRVMRRVSRRG